MSCSATSRLRSAGRTRGLGWIPSLAAIAATIYVAGLATALEPDLPTIGLACLAAVVIARRPFPAALAGPSGMAVLAFVAVMIVSSVLSDDVARSLRLGIPVLPSLLLFVLIAGYFDDDRDLRLLYLAYTGVAAWLGLTIVVRAASHRGSDPTALMALVGSPLLVVPNDVALLAVLAPLTASVVALESSRVGRALGVVSLTASIAAVTILESRIAMAGMLSALGCWVALYRRRNALVWSAAAVPVALFVDGFRGFPLVQKLGQSLQWNPRVALWLSALAMARDAPLFGHGPHSFGVTYLSYLTALRLPPWLPVDARVAPWAHSLFLESLAEQGACGLAALVLLLGSSGVLAIRAAARADREPRILACGAAAALAGFTVTATSELTLLRHWVVAVLLTLAGSAAYVARRATDR
jgi:O-antigen ligase